MVYLMSFECECLRPQMPRKSSLSRFDVRTIAYSDNSTALFERLRDDPDELSESRGSSVNRFLL